MEFKTWVVWLLHALSELLDALGATPSAKRRLWRRAYGYMDVPRRVKR